MKTTDSPRDISQQLDFLTSASDAKTRNAAALRLAESRDPRVLPILLSLIQEPALRNERGTLVHCLAFYDVRPHFRLLADLVANGNWEVAHEAHSLLSSIEELDGEQVNEAFASIDDLVRQGVPEHWRKDLLEDLLSMFG